MTPKPSLSEDVAVLKNDVATIKSDVHEMREEHGAKLDKMATDFATLTGTSNFVINLNAEVANLKSWRDRLIGALVLTEVVLLPIAWIVITKKLNF